MAAKPYKDRDWMHRQYVVERKSTYQIADEIAVGKSTVDLWLRKLGIPLRTKTEANKLRAKVPGDDAGFLGQIKGLYETEQLTAEEIGGRLGLSKSQTKRLLHRAGTAVRGNSEAHVVRALRPTSRMRVSKARAFSREMLERMYHQQGLSTYEIAKVSGAARTQVFGKMQELEITTRDVVQAQYHRLDGGNHVELTPRLREILDGELLGDGCVTATSNRSGTFSYSSKHKQYADWLFELLSEHRLDMSVPHSEMVKCAGKLFERYQMASRAYPELLPYRHLWYPGGVKRVPPGLKLTPTICRHWYIGDGSLCKKGGYIHLFTQCFPKEEVEFLAEQLSGRIGGARLWRVKTGHGWVIGILKRHVPAFLEYIGPCPEGIRGVYGYKWGERHVS